MVADFTKPTTASPYTTFPAEVRELFAALATMMEGVTADNIPTLAKRINATTRMLEQFNGTAWVDALLKAADSALLDGQSSAFYRDASNINAGTINTARLPAASTTAKGAVELATTTEAAGTSGSLAVTPAGLSAVFTAAAILERLLTVDGAGSGLDADTIDGFHAAYFAAASHSHTYASLTGKPTLGTASAEDIGTGDTDVPTVATVKSLSSKPHAPQSIVKAPLGARPAGWSPADCDAPVASVTASGSTVTVQSGLQVAYADSGQVRLSDELAAPLTVDLSAEADGTKYIYVNLNADGSFAGVHFSEVPPGVGSQRAAVTALDIDLYANTSNTLATGSMSTIVASSSRGSSYNVSRVADGDINTQWESATTPVGGLAYRYNTPKKVIGVVYVNNGASTGPKDFTLTSSPNVDGTDRTIQKTIVGKTYTTAKERSVYMFDAPVSAREIAIVVTDTPGSTYLECCEFYPLLIDDWYNTVTQTQYDKEDTTIRRVYIGSVVKSGGVITDVNCYAIGAKVTLPVNGGANCAVVSKYTIDSPFLLDSTSQHICNARFADSKFHAICGLQGASGGVAGTVCSNEGQTLHINTNNYIANGLVCPSAPAGASALTSAQLSVTVNRGY